MQRHLRLAGLVRSGICYKNKRVMDSAHFLVPNVDVCLFRQRINGARVVFCTFYVHFQRRGLFSLPPSVRIGSVLGFFNFYSGK